MVVALLVAHYVTHDFSINVVVFLTYGIATGLAIRYDLVGWPEYDPGWDWINGIGGGLGGALTLVTGLPIGDRLQVGLAIAVFGFAMDYYVLGIVWGQRLAKPDDAARPAPRIERDREIPFGQD